MDIIKTFESNSAGMHITIRGTHEEPLFRASDIGAILDIAKIRNTISDFDSTEKVAHTVDTPGGPQEVLFLTEKGLYQVLFTSRKPIAKQFKNWVCEVIKEIRLNGKYQLEQQLKETESKLLNYREQTLLETHGNTRGVYLAYVDKNKQEVKFGHGIIEDRVKIHKKEIGETFTIQYVIETIYDRELEQLIKLKLKNRIMSKQFPKRKAMCTELIKLTHDYNIEDLYNDIIKLKKTLKDDLIEHQKHIISDLKQRLGKYEDIEDGNENDDNLIVESPSINEEPKEKKKMPFTLTEKLKKKVYKFCISGSNGQPELITIFDSITDAAKDANISPISLSQRVRMGTNISGFIWSFENKLPTVFFSTKNTIVYKYDSDLNLLHKYPSIAEAARLENIEKTKLQRLCRTNTLFNNVIYSRSIDLNTFNKPTPINGKAVSKIDVPTGEIIKTFNSATEAALEAGVNQSAISRRIKNNTILNGIQYKFVDNN